MTLGRVDLQTDVLVVGSGAAGLMAALEAAAGGADVVLATKGGLRLSTTQIAEGGFAAALGHADARDNPRVHLDDSLRAAEGLASPALALQMVQRAIDVARQLDAWGTDLIKLEDGRFLQKANQNHTYPRTVNHYDRTGQALVGSLLHQLRASSVRVLEHTMIADVVLAGGRVGGAWGLEVQSGRLLAIRTGAIVLATGGGAQVFHRNDNPPVNTGDGYGIALRAGAKLADMEMIEYQLATLSPAKLHGRNPHPNALLSRGARLFNGHGERFMHRYDPERLEATRDRSLVCRATGLEIYAGRGTLHGGVYLDLSDASPELDELQILPPLRQRFSRNGVDLRYQPIEAAPFGHTFLGGVVIDEQCQTGVPGLLAAGETTGRVHGARRLGGNALTDALVFGVAAGEAALGQRTAPANRELAAAAAEAGRRLGDTLARETGRDADEVRLELQLAMDQDAMAVRDGAGLERLVTRVRELRHGAVPSVAAGLDMRSAILLKLKRALELDNLLLTAEAVALSALKRRESRGSHYRVDCPQQDDANWRRNLYVSLRQGGLDAVPGPTAKDASAGAETVRTDPLS